jgi:hypothetical protein
MAFTWDIDRSAFPPLPTLSDPPTPTEQAAYDEALAIQSGSEDVAVAVLWALSGRQYGLNDVTVRPCRSERSFGMGSTSGLGYRDGYAYGGLGSVFWNMFIWNGDDWLADGSLGCGCVGQCRVSGPRMIHLPGPAQTITSVTINGTVQDASTYTLEGDVLYRIGAVWPFQDLGRPAGERGTWTVEYQRGIPVPNGVAQLTGQLALEMFNAVKAPAKCRLPRNVVATSRNGVTYQVYDPTTFYEAGKTGMPEIDLWLMSVNPNHIMQAPSVL